MSRLSAFIASGRLKVSFITPSSRDFSRSGIVSSGDCGSGLLRRMLRKPRSRATAFRLACRGFRSSGAAGRFHLTGNALLWAPRSKGIFRPAGKSRTEYALAEPLLEETSAMKYQTLLTDLADGVMTVTLNRPATLNAFNTVMSKELIDFFQRVNAMDEVRSIVVTGAGRAFCAAADISVGNAPLPRVTDRNHP